MYNKHGTHKHVHTHTTHMQKADLSDNCCQPSLVHIPMDSDHFRNRKFHPELDNGTAWYNPHQKGMADNLKTPRAIRPNKQNTRAYRYSSIWQSNSSDELKSQAQQSTDTGFVPQCSKVIFLPESAIGADSLTVFIQPLCAITCINIGVHVQNPKHWQANHCLDTQKYALTGRNG